MRRAVAPVAAGTGAAAVATRRSLMPWPKPARIGFPSIVGGITALGVAALVMPRKVGVPVVLTAAAGFVAVRRASPVVAPAILERLAEAGRSIDSAYAQAPSSDLVSGGSNSLVVHETLGREGARFVADPTTPDEITSVTGLPPLAEPIRVCVEWDSAATVEERAELAVQELLRTNAFSRSILVVQSPSGSGYANQTPVATVEMLTRGDCATVVVGYGYLASMLSIPRVPLAARTQRLLLDAIAEQVASRRAQGLSVPRIVVYGESLGARVQEAGILGLHDSADAVASNPLDLSLYGIDAALWVGTPGGPEADLIHESLASVSVTVDCPDDIDGALKDFADAHDGGYPTVWFLEHHGDPVVRFRANLRFTRPTWLTGPERGRNIPASMRWMPVLTWLQVGVDTMYATNVKPGMFESHGHDYRADLGAVVTHAFSLLDGYPAAEHEAISVRLEAALRAAEVARAARLEPTT